MKYYRGLKVRFWIILLSFLVIMFNCACMIESYETVSSDSLFWIYIILNGVVEVVLLVYLVLLKNKIDNYEEKNHICK